MRVLITGTSGNIGSAVAKRLTEDARVIGIDRIAGQYTTHTGCITDAHFMEKMVKKIDAIVHCAAYHAPHVGRVDNDRFQKVNVDATRMLLQMALSCNVSRFVFTSTTSVYGCTTRPKTNAIWVTEHLPPHPEDIYDRTKLAAEKLCESAAHKGLDTIVLRMSRCFPEPDPLQLFYRLYRGVDPGDAAEAHWLAVHSPLKGYHLFNISAETPFIQTDCRALLRNPWQTIGRYCPDAKQRFLNMGWQLPATIDRVYVIDSAKKHLNYHPTRNFSQMLKKKTLPTS